MPPKRKAVPESHNASKRPKSTRKAASQATQAVASLLAATSGWEDGDDGGDQETVTMRKEGGGQETMRKEGGGPEAVRQREGGKKRGGKKRGGQEGTGKEGGDPEAVRQEGGGAARQERGGKEGGGKEGGGPAVVRQGGGDPEAVRQEGGDREAVPQEGGGAARQEGGGKEGGGKEGGGPAVVRQGGGDPEAVRQEGGDPEAVRQEGGGAARQEGGGKEGGGPAVARQGARSSKKARREGRSGSEGVEEVCFEPLPREEHEMRVCLPPNCNPAEMSAVDWFGLFWTDDDWESLVHNTNAYAQKQRTPDPETGRPPRPLCGKWRPVTTSELKAWVAITIMMGVYRFRSFRDFWRQQGYLKLGQARVPVRRYEQPRGRRSPPRATAWVRNHDTYTAALSRTRYTKIKRYLHVSDPNEVYSDKEWFRKLEPLNSNIRDKCQELIVPATNTTVDEMMVRFFGRSKHIVKMPKKPIKEGYKIFALCEAAYTYNWLFHSRTVGTTELPAESTSALGLAPTQGLVHHLALSLPHEEFDFNVYMDNLFTTVPLLLSLRERGIGGAGTARSNAFPSAHKVLSESSEWNTVSGGPAAGGKVEAIEWQDQRTVQMLSTIHPLSRKIQKRRKAPRPTSTNGPRIRKAFGDSSWMDVDIPSIINDYNHHKGGVDRADQYREAFFTQQTSRRNWLPLFYWLLDIALVFL
jgi:hypothetical protein